VYGKDPEKSRVRGKKFESNSICPRDNAVNPIRKIPFVTELTNGFCDGNNPFLNAGHIGFLTLSIPRKASERIPSTPSLEKPRKES
jgi:hypothetical protein